MKLFVTYTDTAQRQRAALVTVEDDFDTGSEGAINSVLEMIEDYDPNEIATILEWPSEERPAPVDEYGEELPLQFINSES